MSEIINRYYPCPLDSMDKCEWTYVVSIIEPYRGTWLLDYDQDELNTHIAEYHRDFLDGER